VTSPGSDTSLQTTLAVWDIPSLRSRRDRSRAQSFGLAEKAARKAASPPKLRAQIQFRQLRRLGYTQAARRRHAKWLFSVSPQFSLQGKQLQSREKSKPLSFPDNNNQKEKNQNQNNHALRIHDGIEK